MFVINQRQIQQGTAVGDDDDLATLPDTTRVSADQQIIVGREQPFQARATVPVDFIGATADNFPRLDAGRERKLGAAGINPLTERSRERVDLAGRLAAINSKPFVIIFGLQPGPRLSRRRFGTCQSAAYFHLLFRGASASTDFQ